MKKPLGFTIIEVMIATSIFSVILLVAIAGFSGIGNLFYKGVAITQTQSIASQTMSDLKTNIQLASSVTTPSGNPNYGYYCAGNARYTYQLFRPLTSSAEAITTSNILTSATGNYGLIKDTLPGASGCASPCYGSANSPAGCAKFNKPQEVLAENMRLIEFNITNNSSLDSQLYTVNVNIAYGPDEDFDNVNDPDTMVCKGGLSEQRFCAVIRLSSSVYQGLHS